MLFVLDQPRSCLGISVASDLRIIPSNIEPSEEILLRIEVAANVDTYHCQSPRERRLNELAHSFNGAGSFEKIKIFPSGRTYAGIGAFIGSGKTTETTFRAIGEQSSMLRHSLAKGHECPAGREKVAIARESLALPSPNVSLLGLSGVRLVRVK